MSKKIVSQYILGVTTAIYFLEEETQNIGFTLIPTELKERFTLEGTWQVESLVQAKIVGDYYPVGFSQGITMRNSETAITFHYKGQKIEQEKNRIRIETVVENEHLMAYHYVDWEEKDEAVTTVTKIENKTGEAVSVEMLASFSISNIFSFEENDRVADMKLHRLRSKWSEEGRLETQNCIELQLEPSWQRYGVQSIRYGQVGTMPVRGYFPWVVLEDSKYCCTLGGMLCYAGSWQMEVYDRDDRLAISGGLADREFGHWKKILQAGETLEGPVAILSSCMGDVDRISQSMTQIEGKILRKVPEEEKSLPILFNEFCTTWGKPSEENIKKIAEKLKGKGIRYFVIDAGWYADTIHGWESNMGDWNICEELFPHGLGQTVETIRANGMLPGIWFEIETCGIRANAYHYEEFLLKRDAHVITTGKRRFWDMRKPEVIAYLSEKVIGLLKRYEFEYLKIDYNDNIGIGCDGAESLGEGLRQQVYAAQGFLKRIRTELPNLVIENCSSGGHRLEPSQMALSSMASFSDAHECNSIPIIAANVHRAIHPAQSQIWAVLRKEDTEKRLRYSLTNTFLGRMCLSGDIHDLNSQQWKIVESAIMFYKEITPIIREGRSYRFGPQVLSYAKPKGWQVVIREGKKEILVIVHTFGDSPECITIKDIPLQLGQLIKMFQRKTVQAESRENILLIRGMRDFEGAAFVFESNENK